MTSSERTGAVNHRLSSMRSGLRSTSRVRVLVAEPNAILSVVVERCVLASDMTSRLTATRDAEELIAIADGFGADVVIGGPTCPHEILVTAVPRLLSQGARTLVLSSRALDDRSSLVLLAGASGFLIVEDASMADVSSAVRAVASGENALHPTVVQAVLERWRATRSSDVETRTAPSDPALLTARERDVLTGLREGLTTRQLATRLAIAEKTVEAHKSRLYAKLGARNQSHAIRIANDRGFG